MRLVVTDKDIKKLFALVLPSIILLSQWYSIAGIHLSWIIYILLLLNVGLSINAIKKNTSLLLFITITLIFPILTFVFGMASEFNGSLFFSILTGLVLMVYICLMSDRQLDWFMRGLLLSCILFSLWGVYEIGTGHYVLFTNRLLTVRRNWVGAHYPGVAFANTNDLAQYLAFSFPFCFFLLRKHRIALLTLFALVFYVTFHSESKISMLSILVEFFLLLFLITGFGERHKALKIAGFIILFAGLGYYVNMRYGIVNATILHFFDLKINADYFLGRQRIYLNLLDAAKRLPLGGFGSAYSIQAMPPHNLFIYVLVDYGWIVFAVFICFLFSTGKKLLTRLRSNKDAFDLVCFISLIVFPFLTSVSSTNEQRKIVWVILGILIRQACKRIEKTYSSYLNEKEFGYEIADSYNK